MGNKGSRGGGDEADGIDQFDERERGPQQQQQSQSYYTMIKDSYGALVNAIIRPPRCQYSHRQLGPTHFNFCGKNFERKDFELVNGRGLVLQCSWWGPIVPDRQNEVLPCVIYMHGNSSARVEALSSLSLVLGLGATLLSFDFSGSGLSGGEYVSLGYYERDDLQCVIEYLRRSGTTSTIALWGRSMGAATALMHGERDPSIAAMVLDSAFASLQMLAEEMVEKARQQGMFAPGLLVAIVIKFIRSSVQKRADFDIRALAPIDNADKCFIPAMFVAAEGDHFVPQHHSQMIHDKYGGDKNIVIVEGDHNSPRPRFLFDSIGIFLMNTLQIPSDWALSGAQEFVRKAPWHRSGQHYAVNTAAVDSSELEKMQREQRLYLLKLQSNLGEGEALDMDEMLALSMMQEEEEEIDLAQLGVSESDLAMQANIQYRVNNLLSGGTCSPEKIQEEFEKRLHIDETPQQEKTDVKKMPSLGIDTTSAKVTGGETSNYGYPTQLSPRRGPASNIGISNLPTNDTYSYPVIKSPRSGSASNTGVSELPTTHNALAELAADSESAKVAARAVLVMDSPAIDNNKKQFNDAESQKGTPPKHKIVGTSAVPKRPIDLIQIDSLSQIPLVEEDLSDLHCPSESPGLERMARKKVVNSQAPPTVALKKHPNAVGDEMSSTFFNTYGPGQKGDVNRHAGIAERSEALLAMDSTDDVTRPPPVTSPLSRHPNHTQEMSSTFFNTFGPGQKGDVHADSTSSGGENVAKALAAESDSQKVGLNETKVLSPLKGGGKEMHSTFFKAFGPGQPGDVHAANMAASDTPTEAKQQLSTADSVSNMDAVPLNSHPSPALQTHSTFFRAFGEDATATEASKAPASRQLLSQESSMSIKDEELIVIDWTCLACSMKNGPTLTNCGTCGVQRS